MLSGRTHTNPILLQWRGTPRIIDGDIFDVKMPLRRSIHRHSILRPNGLFRTRSQCFAVQMVYATALTFLVSMVIPLHGVKDVYAEPVLQPMPQWPVGEELSSRAIASYAQNIIKLKVSQSPCSSDVAVLGLVFSSGLSAGAIISVTGSAFTSQSRWLNVTASLCHVSKEACVAGYQGISIIDLKLTNTHLFLLTNRGLYISQDLLLPVTGSLNFTKLSLPALGQMDYTSTTLWFSSECLNDSMYFTDDYVSLIFNEGEGENLNSRCLYGRHPFKRWFMCQASDVELRRTKHHYLSFLYDRHQHSGLLLSYTEKHSAVVSVFDLQDGNLQSRTKFSPVEMDFQAQGILLKENNLIAYGSEVWSSPDRGSSFKHILSLKKEIVTEAFSCMHSGEVLLLTDQGKMYLMKSGVDRFSWLNETLNQQSFLLCDHTGAFMAVSLDPENPNTLSYKVIDVLHLIQTYETGFDSTLALQYITEHTVLLHKYSDIKQQHNRSNVDMPSKQFTQADVGKVIYFSAGGQVLITEVLKTGGLSGFTDVVVGDILELLRGAGLRDEPMQSYDLLVKKTDPHGLNITLQLRGLDSSQGFSSKHLGKTVLIPGNSSYLIMGLLSEGRALAKATMPALVPSTITYKAGDWLLFSLAGQGSWGMREGLCRHALHSMDGLQRNSVVRINFREKLNFTFRAVVTDNILPLIYHKKLMTVILTNPHAMSVVASHSWDATNSHVLTITAHSTLCNKTTTMVTVFIPEASLLCSMYSFSFVLQNSCPEGLRIIHVLSQPLSNHNWLHGDPLDGKGNKRLFNLPVNYRPPSQFGLLIPTTDNIYNADPSKSNPYQYHSLSKNTGRYKQCADKASVEECGCTDLMRLSSHVINSDCRQRVLRLVFPVLSFNVPLFLRQTNHPDKPLRPPYFVTITEVNSRTGWNATGASATPTMQKISEYMKTRLNETLYNPEGLRIHFYGSELFHFRISVIRGVELCDLAEEIQVYVDGPPLPFYMKELVKNMTAIFLGGLLFSIFLLRHKVVILPTKKKIKAFFRRRQATVLPLPTDRLD